jgi:hypothetical protein
VKTGSVEQLQTRNIAQDGGDFGASTECFRRTELVGVRRECFHGAAGQAAVLGGIAEELGG